MKTITYLIFTLIIFTSCQSNNNLTQFISDQIENRNSSFTPVNSTEDLIVQWTQNVDEHGFQLEITNSSFTEVTTVMTSLLGNPKIDSENIDGNKHYLYSNKKTGFHIQVIDEKDHVFIVAVIKTHNL